MARKRSGIHGREGIAGWIFTAPMIIILGLFLLVPIVMAFWVSLTNWKGNVDPFGGGPNAAFVGAKNYTVAVHQGRPDAHQLHAVDRQHLLLRAARRAAADGGVPGARAGRQQQAAEGQGLLPHGVLLPVGDQLDRHLDGLPLPLLQHRRRQRAAPAASGIDGPQWFSDSRGLLHIALGWFGAGDNPSWGQVDIFGRSLWEWLSGPSVAMCVIIVLAVWTTTGTFMLMFLAALQDLPVEIDEAAALDGVSWWQKLRLRHASR